MLSPPEPFFQILHLASGLCHLGYLVFPASQVLIKLETVNGRVGTVLYLSCIDTNWSTSHTLKGKGIENQGPLRLFMPEHLPTTPRTPWPNKELVCESVTYQRGSGSAWTW